jgi:hypothetical protein
MEGNLLATCPTDRNPSCCPIKCSRLVPVYRPSALEDVLERELERLKGSIVRQLREGLGKFSEVSSLLHSTSRGKF